MHKLIMLADNLTMAGYMIAHNYMLLMRHAKLGHGTKCTNEILVIRTHYITLLLVTKV